MLPNWYSSQLIHPFNDTYKQEWHAFVQALKKQFASQKNGYYSQLEALNATKKDNETVRHFALKVQQLVKKAGAMKMHLT